MKGFYYCFNCKKKFSRRLIHHSLSPKYWLIRGGLLPIYPCPFCGKRRETASLMHKIIFLTFEVFLLGFTLILLHILTLSPMILLISAIITTVGLEVIDHFYG